MKKFNPLDSLPIHPRGPLSDCCLNIGLQNFSNLSDWLRRLPYGRTTSRTDLTQLFTENKGTCSSKHGLIKAVALENNYDEFKLIIGLYKMSKINTPGIGNALKDAGLSYLPEAHSYIRYQEQTMDLTNEASSFDAFKSYIINELEIEPDQIGQFKIDYHQAYLKKWIEDEKLELDFNNLWQIRETCILNLSSPSK